MQSGSVEEMDEVEGAVITGLVVWLERWRRCFFTAAAPH